MLQSPTAEHPWSRLTFVLLRKFVRVALFSKVVRVCVLSTLCSSSALFLFCDSTKKNCSDGTWPHFFPSLPVFCVALLMLRYLLGFFCYFVDVALRIGFFFCCFLSSNGVLFSFFFFKRPRSATFFPSNFPSQYFCAVFLSGVFLLSGRKNTWARLKRVKLSWAEVNIENGSYVRFRTCLFISSIYFSNSKTCSAVFPSIFLLSCTSQAPFSQKPKKCQ